MRQVADGEINCRGARVRLGVLLFCFYTPTKRRDDGRE